MLCRWIYRVLLVCLPLLPAVAQAAAEPREFVLDNGLKVIVKPDARAPVIVSQVWYKVGSSYEEGGTTGISHVLEHMMFKGTAKHPDGEFARLIADRGGSQNAFTGRDYTAYYEQLHKRHLELAFELEADRMRNLLLKPEDFEKELKVVMEERRLRTDDDSQALTFERFNAVAFLNNPYRHPVIGWMGDLKNLTVSDLRQWYDTWYAPNNATVVVVGDVDPEQVLKLAKQYFGPLPPSELPTLKGRQEPDHEGSRSVVVRAPAEVPYLVTGYQVPALRTAESDWEPYALTVLAAILDGGDSARLSRELVRGAQLAASAGASYNAFSRLGDLFLLDATPNDGRTVAEVDQALQEQVKRLQDAAVTPQELERVKAQVYADKVFELDSLFAQAMQIGLLETVGLDWRLWDTFAERVRQVTPEQVQDVARRYLVDERRIRAELVPLPLAAGEADRVAMRGSQDVR